MQLRSSVSKPKTWNKRKSDCKALQTCWCLFFHSVPHSITEKHVFHVCACHQTQFVHLSG
ncbi:rCG63190, partial [Rattus norvegicus]